MPNHFFAGFQPRLLRSTQQKHFIAGFQPRLSVLQICENFTDHLLVQDILPNHYFAGFQPRFIGSVLSEMLFCGLLTAVFRSADLIIFQSKLYCRTIISRVLHRGCFNLQKRSFILRSFRRGFLFCTFAKILLIIFLSRLYQLPRGSNQN